MGGEVGVFLFFTHAHNIHFWGPAARAWRGPAAYPRHGMGPCCFPTFTLCSHVVFCTRSVQGLAVLWGSLWGMAEVIARVLVRCRLISRSNSGEGRLDSSVPLFFSCSRPLSRSSERDARIERLLTNRPSSASTPLLESSSMLLLLVFAR